MLSVSYETILHKMSQQLALAKDHEINEQTLKQHIAHVHMLCELILAEDRPNKCVQRLEESSQQVVVQSEHLSSARPNYEGTKLDDDGANGDSIFDF